ncbi:uncharacterized protein EAF02_009354 [Botrytis sinoallii]|uniref:uncharacterized protein n=1 Tax=Botrytis sinoallii TaxID=1463999 RepID=UPI001901C04B|nr:uncharacterized protein EAF02_009354 [Botrytis sinoallii]KAF7870164.1 hypothetical protein EAF02_009354 [Botrytis sinoallii]
MSELWIPWILDLESAHSAMEAKLVENLRQEFTSKVRNVQGKIKQMDAIGSMFESHWPSENKRKFIKQHLKFSADADEDTSNENNGTEVGGLEGAKEANQADQADHSNDVPAKSKSPMASVKVEPDNSSGEPVANIQQDREFLKQRLHLLEIVANPEQEQTIDVNSKTTKMPRNAQQSQNYAIPPPNAQRRNSNVPLFREHSRNVPSGPRYQQLGSHSSRNSSLETDTPRNKTPCMSGNISSAAHPHMDMPTTAPDNELIKFANSKSSAKTMNFSANQEISESKVPPHGVVLRQSNAYEHCVQCSTPYGTEMGRNFVINYVIDMGFELPLQDCEIHMRRFRDGAKTAYCVLWPHRKANPSTHALTEIAYVAKFLKWLRERYLKGPGNIRSSYIEFANIYPRPHETRQNNTTIRDVALANFQAKTQSPSTKQDYSRKRGREDMGDGSSGHVKRQYH